MNLELKKGNHDTVLEVDFEALLYNLDQYRSLIDKKTKLMVMVKANAYGSGLVEVANFLQDQKVDQLGVAYIDEAIKLRQNGISIPIMIMNPDIRSYSKFERFNLKAEIFNVRHLKRLVKDTKLPPSIDIKIDSGMHRLGFSLDQVPELLVALKENPLVRVDGVFTHFSSSDMEDEDDFTIQQAQIFNEAYEMIVNTIGYSPIKHAVNSSGTVRFPQYHFDMVRLGIGLYGFDPSGKLNLKPTCHLKTVISQIQELRAGDTVGYGRKGRVEKQSRIAILPIGYEDGYLRVFGNGNAQVKINGEKCPTIGNICMDMTMVDVTNLKCEEGDAVLIFGDDPSIVDLAKWTNTIPYEILTNVSSRVQREFI